MAQKTENLEEKYKMVFEKPLFTPSPLFQSSNRDEEFRSVLRPDYSDYSTTTITGSIL